MIHHDSVKNLKSNFLKKYLQFLQESLGNGIHDVLDLSLSKNAMRDPTRELVL